MAVYSGAALLHFFFVFCFSWTICCVLLVSVTGFLFPFFMKSHVTFRKSFLSMETSNFERRFLFFQLFVSNMIIDRLALHPPHLLFFWTKIYFLKDSLPCLTSIHIYTHMHLHIKLFFFASKGKKWRKG